MKYTDEQILDSVKSGSDINTAFKMLMDNYQSKLYHHIRTLVGNHEDADDVLQNTFIKVFKNIQNFEERSSLFTWLFRIATNEALSHLESFEKKQRLTDRLESHANLPNTSEVQGINGDYIKAALDKAINELPQQQKTIFSLRYFEEMSYNDMSDILGVTNGALKASYHHAVKKIENYIRIIAQNEI